MIRLETKQVSKSFDGKKVIEDISISLQKNEIVSLLGVSGAGKTTLFNVISGLMEPDSGEVLLNGKEITGQAGHISYMLQKDLLLPYKTIEENVALPLMIKGEKKKMPLQRCVRNLDHLDLREQKRNIQVSCPAECANAPHCFGLICFQKGWHC